MMETVMNTSGIAGYVAGNGDWMETVQVDWNGLTPEGKCRDHLGKDFDRLGKVQVKKNSSQAIH